MALLMFQKVQKFELFPATKVATVEDVVVATLFHQVDSMMS